MTSTPPPAHRVLAPGTVFCAADAMRFDGGRLIESRYAPAATLPLHAHELPAFVLVVSGGFQEDFEGRNRQCQRGTVVYRPRGERHRQQFHPHRSVCLTIELPDLDKGRLRTADGCLPLAGMPSLFAMCVYDQFRASSGDRVLGVEESVARLVASAERRRLTRERREPRWLGRVRDLIEARYRESLQLAELAREAGVHRVHLSRTMQQYFGCGISEYLRRRRVHHACRLLKNRAGTLSEIAIETGFSDENHMRRVFVGIMGRSPREYRDG